jgi:hypothetical protein
MSLKTELGYKTQALSQAGPWASRARAPACLFGTLPCRPATFNIICRDSVLMARVRIAALLC